MSIHDTKRISRLISIITFLQTKSLISATELAKKFSVSVRTIYRDIRALEDAGIPIYVEEGKGYKIIEDYRLPPVMFTENEANAVIAAEQLVMNTKDSSLVQEYSSAIDKIKSVMTAAMKEKIHFLSERTVYKRISDMERTSYYLSDLQYALTNFRLVIMKYIDAGDHATKRTIEPFALLSTRENWLLVAWCRLRKDFRYFRLDRITSLEILDRTFTPHEMTLQQFFEKYY